MNRRSITRLALFALALASLRAMTFAAAEADLLVAYDQTHASAVGGQDNANVLALNAVAGSNLINERSGTGARVRVVGYHQAAQYSYQRTSKGGFVGWLANYDSRLSDVVDAGNARGADLVTFICVSTEDGAAAVAQQPGRYSAFDPGSFWAAVVAHELGGHNYGCDHRGGRAVPGQKTVMMHNYCDGGGATPPYFFSNPNIWLGGGRLIGEASCLGDPANGGDNAYLLSTTAQGVADSYDRIVIAPNLGSVVRRWKFNQAAGNAPTGTTVLDEVTGTALATVQGNGATFTGTGLRLPGGASGSGAAYVALPGALISGYTNVTIEIWAKTLSVQNWARIFDFHSNTSNYITLTSARGTDLWQQRFGSAQAGTYVELDSDLPTFTGVMHHYAARYTSTGASTGRWQWYRDGEVVAYLDVAYALSSLTDVNNWLGRSAYAADALANCEYAEVRISNASLSSDQIAANARLGPNHIISNATLTAADPIGQTSFNAAGRWSDGLAPSAGKSYETFNFRLRTPADGTSRTFAGQSLKLTGGSFTWKGTANSTITVSDFTLRGTDGELLNAGSGTFTLAGALKAEADETLVRAANGPITITANLSGDGDLLCVNNTVTLSGTNTAFTGRITVGDGRFSRVDIDSEARLGANPATFTNDHLTLNRGTLRTNATLTIDDANRGIRVGASAGIFSVASGTTCTIAVPISGTSSGAGTPTAPLFPNPISGIFIKEGGGTLALTHPNNSHCGEIVITAGEVRLDGAGRLNNGDHHMPTVLNATLNVNTTADQILGGTISGGGTLLKNNTGTTTFYGANTFTGSVTINAGTVYARAGNAATNRNFSYVSGIVVNGGATLKSQANSLFGWDGTQAKPITVNAAGTLTTDAAGTDVNVGTITLAGGTLAGFAQATWGSWNFKRVANAKILVTENSTVSAPNVGLGTTNAIDVAAGKTLTFSGTITDLSSEGVCALVKSGGTGTLTLTNTNTYTGATTVSAGMLLVNGSITASATTVASGATLGGTGTMANLTLQSGGILAPGNAGVGTFTATNPALTGTLAMEIASAASADRLNASGTVTLGGALTVTAPAGLPAGTTFTILSKTTPGAISGTFTGKPQDSVFAAGGNNFIVSYTGGDGNDVTLTVATAQQAWRFTHFGTVANTGTAADNFDANGDGELNLMEFATAQNPNATTNTRPALARNGANLEFTYTRANVALADGVTFTVEWRDDLTSGAWSSAGVTEQILTNNGTAQTVLATVAAGPGPRFVRLRVVK